MSTGMISSMDICPLNFEAFTQAQKQIDNVDAILLLSKLKFHQINSKIKESGSTWIARSREQLSIWFGCSTKKIDRLLLELSKNNHIKKRVGLWYGERKLFISTTDTLPNIPINHKLFETIRNITGSIEATLVFSKIAFAFANSKIKNEDMKWCCLTEKDLSKIANISLRTLDKIIESLQKKGLLIKRKYCWHEKYKTHYHIPEHVIKTILKNSKDESVINIQSSSKSTTAKVFPTELTQSALSKQNAQKGQFCHSPSVNLSLSIKLSTKEKKTNNNTVVDFKTEPTTKKRSDINFYSINFYLTNRQEKYLDAAIAKTVISKKLTLSNQTELREELVFALLNPQQRKNILSFPHAVSRFMKILSSGNWKTPIGFHKYSEAGRMLKTKKDDALVQWEIQKKAECHVSEPTPDNQISTILTQYFKPINKHLSVITEKAIQIAKKIVNLDNDRAKGQIDDNQSKFFDLLMDSLESYLKQGADYDEVKKYLI